MTLLSIGRPPCEHISQMTCLVLRAVTCSPGPIGQMTCPRLRGRPWSAAPNKLPITLWQVTVAMGATVQERE